MEDNQGTDLRAYLSVAENDRWILISLSGWRPLGRYKHSAQIVKEKLYVIGGSRNGRYLSDIQVFDLRTLKWSTLSLHAYSSNDVLKENFPAMAGHSLVKWESKLLVVAGHSKEASDTVTVWSIDLETSSFSVVNTHGRAPTARGGQSVAVVGTRLLIFGGESTRGQLLNDLHILDLSTMCWDLVQTKNMPPAPRFDHTASVHSDQYLLIFGGSSHSTCFNDLHVLDLQTMEWSQPETQGIAVAPRGGHASTTVDEHWYIVGGGDNRSGATDTVVLNTSKLVWSLSTTVGGRDPLASEGLTVCSATMDGEKFLIAFGGYNGKYNNDLFVLKPKTRDSKQPRLFQSPAAAAAAASVTAAYALAKITDKNGDSVNSEGVNLKLASANSGKVVAVDTDKLTSEKKSLESKLEEVLNENSRLKNSLDEMNNSHNLLLMELQSVQGHVAAESSRCFKLEAQIAEIQKRLESFSSIEQELENLQHQKLKIVKDTSAPQRQDSGGIWRWMAGTTQSP
ncbi:acyl-CoA-binding domain-containing protein 4 [Asparagus officinalis]|nr:acyl-CoA-binding domain-containing protein 4 [Asparagus officinalis]